MQNILKKNPPPNTPDELSQHELVDYNYREGGAIWTMFKRSQQITVRVNAAIVANNAFFAKKVALANGGIARLPNFMVEQEMKTGKLVQCLADYKTLSQPVWLIHPYTNQYMPKKVRIFIDFIIARIRQIYAN